MNGFRKHRAPGHSLIAALLLGCMACGWPARSVTAEPSRATPTAIDVLLIEDQIRQRLALYSLLADGDGLAPRNFRALTDTIFTPDVVIDVYAADGKLTAHIQGREQLYARASAPKPDGNTTVRHFMVSTYFDEVSRMTAKTRTVSMAVRVTATVAGKICVSAEDSSCGGRVTQTEMLVYHDTWAKTSSGWQKSNTKLVAAN